MAVRILTDSTADIPRSGQKPGHHSRATDSFFGEEAYLDGIELDNAAFIPGYNPAKYRHAPRSRLLPPLWKLYQTHQRGGRRHLSVTLSSKLSGTYQSACTARDSLPEDLKKIPIDIVDSESVSIGMNMAIMHAAEEAQQGSGLEEIKANLLDRLARTRVLFVLDTLEYLKRGGRIGGAVALVGDMLSVKPILTIKNGLIDLVERPRTRSKAYARIAQLIGEMAQPEEFAIVESDTAVGQQLAQALQESYTGTIPTYKLGAVVGTYTGPGTAGVAFITQPS